MPPLVKRPDFVVVEPLRTSCIYYSRVLDQHERLRLHCIGTRRGVSGVRPEVTRLKPAIGVVAYAGAKCLPPFQAESFRFRLHPWLDRWACRQLQPGDRIISSYGYANACFKYARQNGGLTFLDAGNSHPDNFWEILSEELRRWGSPYLPVARHHYERSLAMLEHTDYILAPSRFVANSFLQRGFAPDRVLLNHYPVDLRCFAPAQSPRPAHRPLTIISTGRLSLRKGTPYLLEAFRLIHRKHPTARFLLTETMESNIRHILRKFADLPIDWSPGLPHPQLAERLRSADVFVLPSLEEGFVRTAAEAMACGLQVVLTPNCGTNDLVRPGVNGEVVPIRNENAIVEGVFKCADRLGRADSTDISWLHKRLSFDTFSSDFANHLTTLGLT